MKFIKKFISGLVIFGSLANFCLFSNLDVNAVSSAVSSGIGLSAHCIKAYNENWQYSYGSATEGYVDCSGLIWSYNGVGGNRCDMLAASSEWGYVSNGIPRIHGLGLHQPGHVGVYIGSNQAIDARDYGINCVLHNPYSKSWVEWFKIAGVSYPNTGWVLLNGQAFYYENGQYIVDTQREFEGVTYTFNSLGVSDILPPDNVYTETDYSNIRVTTEPQIDYAAIEAAKKAEEERIAAEKKAEEERLAAEKKAEEERLAAEKKAEEERIAAEKKAEEERLAAAKKASEERKKELQLKRERRIKCEIAERKEKVVQNKSFIKFKNMVKVFDSTEGLSVNDEEKISSCNVLIVKNSTLNNDINVNNIESKKEEIIIVDLSNYNYFVADSIDNKEKAKTEYMDIMYSDTFEFNNDVLAYSSKGVKK